MLIPGGRVLSGGFLGQSQLKCPIRGDHISFGEGEYEGGLLLLVVAALSDHFAQSARMVTVKGGFDGLHPVHLSTAIQKHHRPSNGLEQGPLKPEGYPHESNHQPLAPPFPHLGIKEACRLEARQP